MHLRRTQKLLRAIGNPPLPGTEEVPGQEGLGYWYAGPANLIRIDRKKCLLFTNEMTLYSFLIPAFRKQNLNNIIDEFLINLNLNLQAEGFNVEVINKVMQGYQHRICKDRE